MYQCFYRRSLSVRDKDLISNLIGEECNKAETTAENLLRAPEACCIIQALTVLACCCSRDASLKTGESHEKFEYLRRPDSFKASLYQVITSMCETFRVAHNSMDKIHLSLNGMPELMTDILEDMDDLTSTEAIDNIEYGISTLQQVSNICVEQAKNADNECKKSINVIQELLECALATQGRSERRTAEAKQEFEQQQRLKKQQDELIQELERQYEEQRTIAREAMEDYKLRMTQSTAFNEVVGVMLLDNLNTLIHTVGKTTMNVTSVAGNIPIATADVIKEFLLSNKTPVSKEELMAKAVENVLVELMEDIIEESTDKIKENVDDHLNNLASVNTYKISSEFGKMLQRTSKKLIEGLESLKKNDPESVKKFEKSKGDVLINLKAYEKANEIGNSKSAPGKNDEPLKGSKSEELITLMKTRLENLKISRDTVSAERKLQEELRKERTKADAGLVEIIGNLERLKIEEIDLKEVLKYLQEGIKQLSRVQVAWSNIILFFDSIKNSVEGPLIQHIHGYTTRVQNTIASPEKGVSDRQRNILFREVTKACAVANVLMQSAAFYKTLSSKHIKPVTDDTIMKIGMTQDEALAQKHNIGANFNEIRDAVKASVEEHNHFLSSKVLGAMKKQGFDIGRAIENSKGYKSLISEGSTLSDC